MRKALLLLVILWLPSVGVAKVRQVDLAWADLESFVGGKKVAVVLPDGARVQGTVSGVSPEALLMDISKSSDEKLHPKGKTTIPRSSVSMLEVRARGIKWQVIGTAAGVSIGLCAVFVAGGVNSGGSVGVSNVFDYVPPAWWSAIPIGGGLGYLAGRVADNDVTHIKIIEPREKQTGSAAPLQESTEPLLGRSSFLGTPSYLRRTRSYYIPDCIILQNVGSTGCSEHQGFRF